MIAIGIGASSKAARQDFAEAIDAMGALAGRADVVATLDGLHSLALLRLAAGESGLAVRLFSAADLRARQDECLTRSERAEAVHGVSSVAEAAALAAAGPGAKLMGPRMTFGAVTAAAATQGDTRDGDGGSERGRGR